MCSRDYEVAKEKGNISAAAPQLMTNYTSDEIVVDEVSYGRGGR